MKIAIATDEENNNIVRVMDISNPRTKGEVSHFIAELEIIKLEPLELWEKEAD